jgi:hypothetical protein
VPIAILRDKAFGHKRHLVRRYYADHTPRQPRPIEPWEWRVRW